LVRCRSSGGFRSRSFGIPQRDPRTAPGFTAALDKGSRLLANGAGKRLENGRDWNWFLPGKPSRLLDL
jgi:hypothetical protein